MDAYKTRLIQESWSAVTPLGSGLTKRFYDRLFMDHPELRDMFPDNMEEQGKLLFKMINISVSSIGNLEYIDDSLRKLGRRHEEYGVIRKHVPAFGNSLIETLQEELGSRWSEAHTQAWQELYDKLMAKMGIDSQLSADSPQP